MRTAPGAKLVRVDPTDLWPFVYALAIGLLIGTERERSHPASRRLAGSRTFALVGLVGAAAAFLGSWPLVAALVIVGLLVVLGYRRTSVEDPGTTTEVALVAVFLLGAMTVDHAPLAAALAIVTTILASQGADPRLRSRGRHRHRARGRPQVPGPGLRGPAAAPGPRPRSLRRAEPAPHLADRGDPDRHLVGRLHRRPGPGTTARAAGDRTRRRLRERQRDDGGDGASVPNDGGARRHGLGHAAREPRDVRPAHRDRCGGCARRRRVPVAGGGRRCRRDRARRRGRRPATTARCQRAAGRPTRHTDLPSSGREASGAARSRSPRWTDPSH